MGREDPNILHSLQAVKKKKQKKPSKLKLPVYAVAQLCPYIIEFFVGIVVNFNIQASLTIL